MIEAFVSVFGVIICLIIAIKASKDDASTTYDSVPDPDDD
ncbi:hypothetical protein MSI_17040 [Treponema sp. JC4]|nr:hypothetical protein MSI_17040 [Treponema sp. JC4]